MKSFFKTVLAVILGLTIFILLPLMLLGLFSGLSSNETGYNITKNSILEIDFKTPIIESYDDIEFNFTDFESSNYLTFYNILTAINKAKDDDNIKGISLKLNGSTTDYAQSQSIRNALINFKSANKFIYAYGDNLSQRDYYIGSVADSIFVSPLSNIELKGISAEVTFYKKLFDKIGVEFEIIKHGKYKSAVEPYFLDHMSPESKEQTQVLIDDIWKNISSEIAQSRKLPMEQFNILTDSLKAFNAKSALQVKLIDGIKYENQYKELLGIDTTAKDQENPIVSVSNYLSSLNNPFNKDQIAIIYASGVITSGNKSDGIQDQNIIKKIQKAKKDASVKSVVLRINSPGGDAAASERILHELRLLQKEKPLIVSFGGVAASGGYYIAGAADTIIASPNTITGSIGVYGAIPNVKKLAEKVGVSTDITETNANSNIFSPLTGTSPKFKEVIHESIEDVYDLFLENVAQNRKVSKAEIDSIAQGRVWSGIKAKQNGLVDVLGDLDTAIAFAAKKAGIEKFDLLELPKKKSEIEMIMEKFGGEKEMQIEVIIGEKLGPEIYNSYKEIDYLKNSGTIHLKLPYIIELK
ncbi:protease [Flavobacteriaceae bacterium UJ101]|nr:protease [Flavobacteriaceae bacterium UJ101]